MKGQAEDDFRERAKILQHGTVIFWPEGPQQVSPGQSAAASAAERHPGNGWQEVRFALKGHDNRIRCGQIRLAEAGRSVSSIPHVPFVKFDFVPLEQQP